MSCSFALWRMALETKICKFDRCGRPMSASCFVWEWFWGELHLSGRDRNRTQWRGRAFDELGSSEAGIRRGVSVAGRKVAVNFN